MENNVFCTYFNKNYLPHGRSLYESLIKHMPEAKLLIMCMDEESYQILQEINYPNIILAKCSDMEKQNPELLVAKKERTLVEYFYTCSSATCKYAFDNVKDMDTLTYLDADLYFFSDPQPVFNELKGCSVGIIEHRFSRLTKRNKIYGLYNVGWITFRNDSEGRRCVTDWYNNCIDWCYQILEGDKYADQKYLDKWPKDYTNVHIIKNVGANLAIWNINNYRLNKKNGQVLVNNNPLIFYHFANFKQLEKNIFKTDLSRVFYKTSGIIKEDVYIPYIRSILKNQISDSQIETKKDLHAKGLKLRLMFMARRIREIMYDDIIKY